MALQATIKKVARKLEEAITGEEPQMDILDTLEEEHRVVALLLEQMNEAKSSAQRASLLKRIKQNLVPHARAEEAVLYKSLLKVKDKASKTRGEEGFLEHGLIDVMLQKLSRMRDKMSPEFSAGAKVLMEIVAHHVQEEESAFWDSAREQYSDHERRKMNANYLKRKKAVRVSV